MFSATNPPPNRCKEPGHVFSEITGRCKTCHLIKERLRRGPRGPIGAPIRAATVQGSPCRTCGGTERYLSGACIACQRRRGSTYCAVNASPSGAFTALTRWLLQPPVEMTTDEN